MGSGPNLLYLRTPWVGGLPPMVKNLSTEKTHVPHLAAKYKKSNLNNSSIHDGISQYDSSEYSSDEYAALLALKFSTSGLAFKYSASPPL